MTNDAEPEIERGRAELEASGPDDVISKADAAAILRMSDDIQLLGPSAHSAQRYGFCLKRCRTIVREVGGLADALKDREAARFRIEREIAG